MGRRSREGPQEGERTEDDFGVALRSSQCLWVTLFLPSATTLHTHDVPFPSCSVSPAMTVQPSLSTTYAPRVFTDGDKL